MNTNQIKFTMLTIVKEVEMYLLQGVHSETSIRTSIRVT